MLIPTSVEAQVPTQAFEQVRKIIDDRAASYETGLQTSILGRQAHGWLNHYRLKAGRFRGDWKSP